MRRLRAWHLLMLWILFPTLTLFAEPSTPASDESPICFSDAEWTQFEADVQTIVETTAEAAVKAAVVPLRADLAGLTVERDEWRAEAQAQIERADTASAQSMRRGRTIRWLLVGELACLLIGTLAGFLLD